VVGNIGDVQSKALRLEEEAAMDISQQAARIQMIVNTIAERSLAVHSEARPAYVHDEVITGRAWLSHPRLSAHLHPPNVGRS
jgi:hypothetical protein